jgi:hypothetical protein
MTETSGAPIDAGVPPGVNAKAATRTVRIAPASERKGIRGVGAMAVDRSIRAFRVPLLSELLPDRAPHRLFGTGGGSLG